ncbi:MAG: ABC transporter permease [Bradymonadaceae bacterium]|nr:ABC transporter permease [Lujinxingiaceae bacterium]
MFSFLLRRLFASVFVIIGVVTLVFFILRAVPGDPVESILGEQALEVDKASLRECLNLDRPLYVQYGLFWKDVLDGSLGHLCDERGVTVRERLVANIPATVQLALASMLIALLLAMPLGVAASLRPYSWVDNGSAVVALLGISIPNFWLGPMLLIVFSLMLQALPNPGSEVLGLSALILPAVTLGSGLAAKLTRMTRSSMLEVLNLDYIRTAKAKGLPRWKVVSKHALRNALIPVVTILGLQFGALLTGAIVVEKIFARPGVGMMLLEGIEARNYMIVQGCVLFISFTYVLVNLITDLVYGWVDPRIRYD